MAAFVNAFRASSAVNNLTKLFNNFAVSSRILQNAPCGIPSGRSVPLASLHTTANRRGLMEFFDEKKNWGESTVKAGRSWRMDELRIKSNEDLHKLWFVLLKERNMLLTMEEACKREFIVFPNPERLDKVEESMKNLEATVRERNVAYHMLETGESGERPCKVVYNQLGLKIRYRLRQHALPKFMNNKWHRDHIHSFGGYAVAKFLRKYREKLFLAKRRARTREQNRVRMLMRKFENLDLEAVKQQYPSVDLEKVKRLRIEGHFTPK